MKRERFRGLTKKLLLGTLTLMLVTAFGLSGALVSRADSQATVKARSANIRKEASTDSAVVGSTKQGSTLTVISQVQGSDGRTWYEVYVDANTKGYIRSDLVTITEGGTPPEGGQENNEPPAEVTPVTPVAATVSNDSGRGRIRSNASTTSTIVAEAPNGAEMTVTGQASDAEGKIWYQVSYASEGSQVDGFIRSDYVALSGDVTPAGDNPPADGGEEPPAPAVPEKAYDTILQDGEWCLYDTATNTGYSVQSLFEAVDNANKNAQLYDELNKTTTNQKIVIIVLIFLVVAAVAAIAFLVFKIRDMMDAAYFSEVENDTLRKRKAAGNQNGGQRVMHMVGAEKPPVRQPGAPQSQRSAGPAPVQRGAGMPQGQRTAGPAPVQRGAGAPQGQRPQGAVQGQRPAGTAQGQRPMGAAQGQRPAGMPQGRPVGTAQRPMGAGASQRPAGPVQGQKLSDAGQRPQGAVPQGARPGGGVPQDGSQRQSANGQRQAKNFMAEEDEEFDFDFLNYDAEEDGEQ